MSQISSIIGNLPGMGQLVETYEAAITWGPAYQLLWWNGYIDAAAADAGNNPTWKLRPGLVLGQKWATGTYTNYSPTATDGSQIASAILGYGLRMQDVLTGVNTQKFYALVIGGRVKGVNLLGLDQMARAQLSGKFTFDDNIPGNQFFDWLTFQTKTANYALVLTDNFSHFDNAGAVAPVTFTLPPIQNGLKAGFRVVADQNLLVTSFEGGNIVAFNKANASTVSFQTAGARIGGGVVFYTNAAGTLWYSDDMSIGANTVTVV
jgi:hypothetical protein